MYNAETQLAKLKIMLGSGSNLAGKDSLLSLLLDNAKDTINNIRNYNPTEEIPLEEKYYVLQVKMAVCEFNKMGAEGQNSHSENGITRKYEYGDVYPSSLLRQIIPLVKR